MTKVLLSKLRPIRNNIVIVDMEFGEQVTATGLVLMSDDGNGGQYAEANVGDERCGNRQAVGEVVKAIADDNHPC